MNEYNGYEYTPKDPNTAEKLLACLALVFAAASFGVSRLDGIPYPAILQFAAVVFLTVSLALANRSILRSYTYTVTEPDENGRRDFLITEHIGKKHTAVCRVGLSQIRSVEIVRAGDKEKIRQAEKAANVIYRYMTALFPRELMLVTLETGDAVTLLRIPAEKGLQDALRAEENKNCL